MYKNILDEIARSDNLDVENAFDKFSNTTIPHYYKKDITFTGINNETKIPLKIDSISAFNLALYRTLYGLIHPEYI